MKYVAPEKDLKAFTCPHCHTLSQMEYNYLGFSGEFGAYGSLISGRGVTVCKCNLCGGKTVWVGNEYVFPTVLPIEPNQDMPSSVSNLFEEAGAIYLRSPRAACSLLRLAVDQLCSFLGADQPKIDEKIASLVSKGLSVDVQKALDIVRVVGNKAVHPGTIALDVDSKDTANKLFVLINLIVDRMTSEPKKIAELYETLPDSTKEAVKNRDKKV